MRLIIVMLLALFTTRVVLDALGEVNYGIYTLVAGVVGMLAILQSAMSTTSMRYMSYGLGSGDEDLISRTFNTTLFLHLIIGFAVVAFVEIGGYFMFAHFLDIPEAKLFDAKIVFHLMALTTFVAIVAVPYDAVINSHENLLVLSIVDIIGAVLQLAVAIYLTFTNLNLLIIYGLGMFFVQLILRVIKQQYSVRHYNECRLNLKNFDKGLSREIMAFSGWNLFGSIAAVSVTQVRSILLNMFFGVKVNASEGIAKTANNAVNMVSVNLTQAINPQLVKSEGSGDRQRMLRITSMSTKFSIFLFALIAIPVIIEMPYLLNIWLKNVPEFAVVFARLAIIALLIEKFTFEITNAIRAIGKIRELSVTEAIIFFLNIPISYILFKANYLPYTIFIVGIFFCLIVFFERLYFGKTIANMNIASFVKLTILPVAFALLLATTLTLIVHSFALTDVIRLGLVFFVFLVVFSLSIRYFCLSKYEYQKIKSLILKGTLKIKNLI